MPTFFQQMVKKRATPRSRIASSLGIAKAKNGSSLPTVYRPSEHTLSNMRADIGAASLSIYGDPFDLDPFVDRYGDLFVFILIWAVSVKNEKYVKCVDGVHVCIKELNCVSLFVAEHTSYSVLLAFIWSGRRTRSKSRLHHFWRPREEASLGLPCAPINL